MEIRWGEALEKSGWTTTTKVWDFGKVVVDNQGSPYLSTWNRWQIKVEGTPECEDYRYICTAIKNVSISTTCGQ